ncbi:MAG: hypothetical protein JSS45_09820 [Proteobacteria bacterium]|nr:hypothetical protein [Pseudomonadota bacterium]
MQIEATYDDGRLEFIHPIRLKHKRFNLVVNVPDDELAGKEPLAANLPPAVVALADQARRRLDAVRTAPIPPDDELPEPSAKIRERMDAFQMREDR